MIDSAPPLVEYALAVSSSCATSPLASTPTNTPTFASASASRTLVVLALSITLEPLRRFPNNMLMWKTLCNLVTSSMIVGINAKLLTSDDYRVSGHDICRGGTFGDFSLVAFFIAASTSSLLRSLAAL